MSIIEKALQKRQQGDSAAESPSGTPKDTPAASRDGDPDLVERAVARRRGDAAAEPDVPSVHAEREPAADAEAPSLRPEQPLHKIDRARLRRNGLMTPEDERSQVAEEFRLIKRPILSNAFGRRRVASGNLIMLTSALPGEGKTYCSLNLALSIATEMNRTVLLVDADVARPAIPDLLGFKAQTGLLDVLLNSQLDVSDALIKTDVPKLTLLPSGRHHKHATELLASDDMATLVREIGERYSDRVVLFDSPPLLATSEAGVLAGHMGQIVMVVEADRTPQAAVTRAMDHLEGCETVLTLLNKTGKYPGNRYEYGYYGYYDYYDGHAAG